MRIAQPPNTTQVAAPPEYRESARPFRAARTTAQGSLRAAPQSTGTTPFEPLEIHQISRRQRHPLPVSTQARPGVAVKGRSRARLCPREVDCRCRRMSVFFTKEALWPFCPALISDLPIPPQLLGLVGPQVRASGSASGEFVLADTPAGWFHRLGRNGRVLTQFFLNRKSSATPSPPVRRRSRVQSFWKHWASVGRSRVLANLWPGWAQFAGRRSGPILRRRRADDRDLMLRVMAFATFAPVYTPRSSADLRPGAAVMTRAIPV